MATTSRKTVKSNPLDSIASRRKNSDILDKNLGKSVSKKVRAAKQAFKDVPASEKNTLPLQQTSLDPASKPKAKKAASKTASKTTSKTTPQTASKTAKITTKKTSELELNKKPESIPMVRGDGEQPTLILSVATSQTDKVDKQAKVEPIVTPLQVSEPPTSAEELLEREFKSKSLLTIPAELLLEDPHVDIHALHTVKTWSQWSVLAGLIPTPIVDTVAIVGVQIKMIHALSNLYNVEFKKEAALAVVSGLVGGTLTSTLAGFGSVLLGHLPVIGSVMKYTAQPALSYASTYALGRVFMRHFEGKGTMVDLDSKKLATYFKEQYARGLKMFDYDFKTQPT